MNGKRMSRGSSWDISRYDVTSETQAEIDKWVDDVLDKNSPPYPKRPPASNSSLDNLCEKPKRKNSDPAPMNYSGFEERSSVLAIVSAFVLGCVVFLAIFAVIFYLYDFSVQQSNKSYCIDEYRETVISDVPAYCIEYFLRGN